MAALIGQAYAAAGVRRFVQTSSIAVLNGAPGAVIDETNDRDPAEADDYYRSKILADRAVQAFLEATPDMHATFVAGLDVGAGRYRPDFRRAKRRSTRCWPSCRAWFRGVSPVVDARDVALAQIAAAARRGAVASGISRRAGI
ncbi:hypothetical protein ACU4GD_07380 [Cupriavidus basilensis]